MSHLLPEEETTLENYNEFANAWAKARNVKNFWVQEMQLFHKLLPCGTILEIGSGHGRDAAELLDLGYEYVGTDISEGLLKIVKGRFPNQQFYRQSVYDLSFPKGPKFDGFWAAAVLLHIPKSRIAEALQAIRSVVKPGAIGFISLKDGQGEGLQRDIVGEATMYRLFSYWSKEGFEQTLKDNNYDLVDYIFRPVSDETKWHNFFVKTLED